MQVANLKNSDSQPTRIADTFHLKPLGRKDQKEINDDDTDKQDNNKDHGVYPFYIQSGAPTQSHFTPFISQHYYA
ncbi:hypothetical protein D3C73_1042380 [compost metagenome]